MSDENSPLDDRAGQVEAVPSEDVTTEDNPQATESAEATGVTQATESTEAPEAAEATEAPEAAEATEAPEAVESFGELEETASEAAADEPADEATEETTADELDSLAAETDVMGDTGFANEETSSVHLEEERSEAPAGESTDAVANAAAALGDTSEVDAEGEYRRRLREFTRDLKKQPGQWYIIQTYSSYENKVKTNLDMRAQTLEVEEYIHEVVVPIEQVMELKDGKKKLVKRKLLPGYVLVRMDMNDKAWSVVRDTPGVTSFVGNEGNATVVKHRDVAKFLMPKTAPSETGEAAATQADGEMVVAMPEEQETPKYAHDFQVGDAVTILSGALASVSASISEIDPATGKIQALVSIFGRETPVELTPDQIEKIT